MLPSFRILLVALALPALARAQWADAFESYAPGSGIAGQGGWEFWCEGGNDAEVSIEFASSGSRSLRLEPGSNVVQPLPFPTRRAWTVVVDTYVPSRAAGRGWISAMNTYCPRPLEPRHWSTATSFDTATGLVTPANLNVSVPAPLIFDRWVTYWLEIDFPNDRFSEHYGDVIMTYDQPWSSNVASGGAVEIAALNLYSESLMEIYFDDTSVLSAQDCVGDVDGDGDADLADLGVLLANFGCTPPPNCAGDLDGDGDTDLEDLGILLSDFGCGT